MVVTRFAQTVPHPRDFVYKWHSRPGAVRRLTPPFLAEVLGEPDGGLSPGAQSHFQIRGLPPPTNRWTTEYAEIVPGSQFTERLVRGPVSKWTHVQHFEEHSNCTRVLSELDFRFMRDYPFAARRRIQDSISRMVYYRHEQLLSELEFASSHDGPPLRIAVSGSSGIIGRELVALLRTLGHDVVPIIRTDIPLDDGVAINTESGWVDEEALSRVDAVVHLAAEPVGKRFTPEHKRRIAESRVSMTSDLAAAAARSARVRTFVSASAIGYYGAAPSGEVTEESPQGADFLARVCAAWEESADPARDAGLRVVNLRTGPVLTPDGDFLRPMLRSFRAGNRGSPAGGAAWHSWISIDDVVGLYAHAVLDARMSGAVNAVAPQPTTWSEMARELARQLSRPELVPMPRPAAAAWFGREGSRLYVHASQRASAEKAAAAGYEFRHPALSGALRHVLGQTI
ncbi:MAG TPA: TIGR01777 family oxidoreductase [Actinomycetaceae bacterium]|nr:TIGR01777 family oxidoreductase [Actinomycetaceae bacterium]